MPIQVRITLCKPSRIKTATSIFHINNSKIIKITPLTASTIYSKECCKGITLIVVNAQSLNKAAIFTDFICEHQPDLRQQLKLGSAIENQHKKLSLPLMHGYRFLDHSRSSRRGGGTGLIFKTILRLLKANINLLSTRKVISGSRRVN